MTYQDRLHRYEQEKRKLQELNLSAREYEKRIREIARRWRV